MNKRQARRYAYGLAADFLKADLEWAMTLLMGDEGLNESEAEKVVVELEAIRDSLRRKSIETPQRYVEEEKNA